MKKVDRNDTSYHLSFTLFIIRRSYISVFRSTVIYQYYYRLIPPLFVRVEFRNNKSSIDAINFRVIALIKRSFATR